MNQIKSPIKSTTIWGILVSWLGMKLTVILAAYGVPPDAVKAFTDLLMEGGLALAVIGRTVASKKLEV